MCSVLFLRIQRKMTMIARIISISILSILTQQAQLSSLYIPKELNDSQPSELSVYSTFNNTNDCRTKSSDQNTTNEDCQDETQLSSTVVICLNNCADCTKQWRPGVYDGRSCANDCLQQVEDLVESLDPDCNQAKYFNKSILNSM